MVGGGGFTEGALYSRDTRSEGNKMRQGLLGSTIYEDFPGQLPPPGLQAPVLGLWEGGKDAGGWAAAVAPGASHTG